MRKLKTIYDEVHIQCQKDSCQSWPVITVSSMEQAVKETKEDIIDDLEELLNDFNRENLENLIGKLVLEI